MSIHQMTVNDLLAHSKVFEKIPDIVINSELEHEDFEDVQIITLQQYYIDIAYEKAWDCISYKNSEGENLEETLTTLAESIAYSEHANEKEFVEIHKNRVIIGINAKTVTEREINKALAYLVTVEDFTPGEIYKFGEEKKIHYEFASKISSNSSSEPF